MCLLGFFSSLLVCCRTRVGFCVYTGAVAIKILHICLYQSYIFSMEFVSCFLDIIISKAFQCCATFYHSSTYSIAHIALTPHTISLLISIKQTTVVCTKRNLVACMHARKKTETFKTLVALIFANNGFLSF